MLCGSKDCFRFSDVDSKGNVKEFFGLRFGPFSARVQMVFGTFRICRAPDGVCRGCVCALWLQRLCSVAVLGCPKYVASRFDATEFFGLRVLAVRGFRACVQMLFEVFRHLRCSRWPDFA